MDMADPLGCRGLAVGSRHRDELVGEQAPGQLELAEDGDAAAAGRLHDRRVLGNSGALDERPGAGGSDVPWCIHLNFDAGLRKPACRLGELRPGSRAGVPAHHLGTLGAQRKRRRGPRTREPDDQVWTTGKWWPCPQPPMLSLYTVKPTAQQAAATIQKRRMIFVSDHPRSSKWWWMGAIRKTRLRKDWKEITWIATDRASSTKMPPRTSSSSVVLVITARPAMAPPRISEPVSPMKMLAGKLLN